MHSTTPSGPVPTSDLEDRVRSFFKSVRQELDHEKRNALYGDRSDKPAVLTLSSRLFELLTELENVYLARVSATPLVRKNPVSPLLALSDAYASLWINLFHSRESLTPHCWHPFQIGPDLPTLARQGEGSFAELVLSWSITHIKTLERFVPEAARWLPLRETPVNLFQWETVTCHIVRASLSEGECRRWEKICSKASPDAPGGFRIPRLFSRARFDDAFSALERESPFDFDRLPTVSESGQPTATPTADAEQLRATAIVTNWDEICDVLGWPNDEYTRHKFRRLSESTNGPIHITGPGKQPEVIARRDLIAWIESLTHRQEEMDSETRQSAVDREASVGEAARYRHGRDAEIVPEISGHTVPGKTKNAKRQKT